jgi:hypothetical protein
MGAPPPARASRSPSTDDAPAQANAERLAQALAVRVTAIRVGTSDNDIEAQGDVAPRAIGRANPDTAPRQDRHFDDALEAVESRVSGRGIRTSRLDRPRAPGPARSSMPAEMRPATADRVTGAASAP